MTATHGCNSIHSTTAPVKAMFETETVFDGQVEFFDVDHPKAKKRCAWRYVEAGQFKVTCVLEIPPVDSPSAAVDVAIAAKSKELR